jgi:hypoxia up-regulated 1
MVLCHAVDISVAYSLESGSTAIAPPKDIVLTVPSFSTQKERQALLDAAELAGLNVLTLIDETTAAALHYAMDKNFEGEKEQVLLFYNMGGSCLQVSLIRFFNYMQPQRYGAAKSTPALDILAKSWDTTLGGDAVDNIIVEMIATEFNNKWPKHIADPTKNDVRNFARPMTKIRLQANKVKHVLSANLEIPIHLDSVHDDLSVSMTITRVMLEEKMISSGMIQRAVQPVLDVLKAANKTISEINGTELLGGGMRVPIIQAELQKVIGTDEPLGLHINADESFALGAAFAGANISTAFRVRQVGMTDIHPFPIQVTLKDASEETEKKGFFGATKKKKEDSDDESWMKQAVIFKSMGKLGTKKTIAFTHDKDVDCALDYINDDSEASLLPSGTETPLERYSLKGIVDFVKDMTTKKLLNETNPKPKVSLQFELSSSGIAQLVKAEVAVEETYIAQETIEVDDDTPDVDTNSTEANATTTDSTTDDANATTVDANATDANATATGVNETNTTTAKKSKPIKKKKKKITVEKVRYFVVQINKN